MLTVTRLQLRAGWIFGSNLLEQLERNLPRGAMKHRGRLILAICVALATTLVAVGCLSPAQRHLDEGDNYYDRGQGDEAIGEYTEAIKADPAFAPAYANRGGVYVRKGELDKAIADCDKAIELDPTLVTAYINRGAAYYEKGELDKAMADLDKAIELAQERDTIISEINKQLKKTKSIKDIVILKHFENITDLIVKIMGQLLNIN